MVVLYKMPPPSETRHTDKTTNKLSTRSHFVYVTSAPCIPWSQDASRLKKLDVTHFSLHVIGRVPCSAHEADWIAYVRQSI